METATPSTVRAWARENGYEVSDRGRVPVAVQRAFDEAHAEPVTSWPTEDAPPATAAVDPFAAPVAPSPWASAPAPMPSQLQEGRDGFSIAALVLGILPVLGGLLGIVFGVVSLRRIRGTRREGRGMAISGIVLGSVWLALFFTIGVIAALSGPDRDKSGAVTSAGDVTAQDLRVDDCLAKEPLDATRTVEVVPCSGPHAVTVYAVFPIAASGFPGEAAVKRLAEGGCERRLTERYGDKGPQAYVYLLPTKSGWATGDHEVTCMVAPVAATAG